MLNPLDAYAHCGKLAGTARNQRDEARAAFETRHFHRMLELEDPDCRPFARAAFNDAYQSARRASL